MELRHLRYFIAVAEAENFHRAAERMFLVPSALSRQISDLETELGFQLFNRVRGRIRLSRPGEIYLARVKNILADLDAAGQTAKSAASTLAGTLAIGFFSISISRDVIANCVRWFRAEHPEITLALTPLTPLPLLEALREGAIDGAFLANPPASEFEQLRLMGRGWRLAVPDFHPLANRNSISLKDLAGQSFIWPMRSISPYFDDQLLKACADKGLRPQIKHELPNIDLCLSYVAAGLGICFVLDSMHVGRDVHLLEVNDLDLEVVLCFLWRSDRESSPLRKLIQGLRDRGEKAGVAAVVKEDEVGAKP